jgi:hypothetical protein
LILESSLRANRSRECAPDDRLREAIQTPHKEKNWIPSSLLLLAMTTTIFAANAKSPEAMLPGFSITSSFGYQ